MALVHEIDSAVRELAKAIQGAEKEKAQILALKPALSSAGAGLRDEIKRVLTNLVKAQKILDAWSDEYDNLVNGLKETLRSFPEYKKMSVEAEKYYTQLLEEKTTREKAAKKAGAKSPSNEDKLFDAAFKRAKKAYDESPMDMIEDSMKTVDKQIAYMRRTYVDRLNSYKEAMQEYKATMALMEQLQFKLSDTNVDQGWLSSMARSYDERFKAYHRSLS